MILTPGLITVFGILMVVGISGGTSARVVGYKIVIPIIEGKPPPFLGRNQIFDISPAIRIAIFE